MPHPQPRRTPELWRLGRDGWPVERIDLASGIRALVFSDLQDHAPACPWPPEPPDVAGTRWWEQG